MGLFFGDDTPEPAALCELILMVALADGNLGQGELDGLARAMTKGGALESVSWDFAMERARELEDDAPLFFDARDHLAEKLVDPAERKTGIAMAARIAAGDRPLDDAERALLHSVAKTFLLTDAELDKALRNKKAGLGEHLEYVRSRFNDPSARGEASLFDYLADTKADDELRVLMYKLASIRRACTKLFETAEIVSVGELRAVGKSRLRIDAIVDAQQKRWLIRFLGPGESLWFQEHALLKQLSEELVAAESLLLVHAEPLSPPDQALLKKIDPSRIATLVLDV